MCNRDHGRLRLDLAIPPAGTEPLDCHYRRPKGRVERELSSEQKCLVGGPAWCGRAGVHGGPRPLSRTARGMCPIRLSKTMLGCSPARRRWQALQLYQERVRRGNVQVMAVPPLPHPLASTHASRSAAYVARRSPRDKRESPESRNQARSRKKLYRLQSSVGRSYVPVDLACRPQRRAGLRPQFPFEHIGLQMSKQFIASSADRGDHRVDLRLIHRGTMV